MSWCFWLGQPLKLAFHQCKELFISYLYHFLNCFFSPILKLYKYILVSIYFCPFICLCICRAVLKSAL